MRVVGIGGTTDQSSYPSAHHIEQGNFGLDCALVISPSPSLKLEWCDVGRLMISRWRARGWVLREGRSTPRPYEIVEEKHPRAEHLLAEHEDRTGTVSEDEHHGLLEGRRAERHFLQDLRHLAPMHRLGSLDKFYGEWLQPRDVEYEILQPTIDSAEVRETILKNLIEIPPDSFRNVGLEEHISSSLLIWREKGWLWTCYRRTSWAISQGQTKNQHCCCFNGLNLMNLMIKKIIGSPNRIRPIIRPGAPSDDGVNLVLFRCGTATGPRHSTG